MHSTFGRLALGLVATMLTLPATAGQLQWQRGKTPSARRAAETETEAKSKPVSRVHRDGAVRAVQYEAVSGPSFGDEYDGGQLRSLVVETEEASDDEAPVHTAQQLQFESPELDTRYQDELGTPFGEEPSDTSSEFDEEMEEDLSEDLFPPLDEPGAARTDDEFTLPPTDQPAQPSRQPTTQPRQPATPPRTFEPQPSQPRSPRDRDVFGAEPLPRGEISVPPRSAYPDDQMTIDEGSCAENLAKLKASTLQDVDLAIGVTGVQGKDYPVECSIDDGTVFQGRCWSQTVYMWKASALCHKPLYFEDEALERYGHSWGPCCDPLVSGAHFFSKLAVLPYCMGLNPPCECQYALGHYRPGNCAPYMCDPIPIMSRATLLQAGAVVGTAALLP